MKIITSYPTPDMDGIACMYAYSELLNKQGEDSRYFICGNPKTEVQIVCDMFDIKLNSIEAEEILESSEYIIVDLNGKEHIPDIVKLDKIIEIIDHHGLSKTLHLYTSIQRLQIDRLRSSSNNSC